MVASAGAQLSSIQSLDVAAHDRLAELELEQLSVLAAGVDRATDAQLTARSADAVRTLFGKDGPRSPGRTKDTSSLAQGEALNDLIPQPGVDCEPSQSSINRGFFSRISEEYLCIFCGEVFV